MSGSRKRFGGSGAPFDQMPVKRINSTTQRAHLVELARSQPRVPNLYHPALVTAQLLVALGMLTVNTALFRFANNTLFDRHLLGVIADFVVAEFTVYNAVEYQRSSPIAARVCGPPENTRLVVSFQSSFATDDDFFLFWTPDGRRVLDAMPGFPFLQPSGHQKPMRPPARVIVNEFVFHPQRSQLLVCCAGQKSLVCLDMSGEFAGLFSSELEYVESIDVDAVTGDVVCLCRKDEQPAEILIVNKGGQRLRVFPYLDRALRFVSCVSLPSGERDIVSLDSDSDMVWSVVRDNEVFTRAWMLFADRLCSFDGRLYALVAYDAAFLSICFRETHDDDGAVVRSLLKLRDFGSVRSFSCDRHNCFVLCGYRSAGTAVFFC